MEGAVERLDVLAPRDERLPQRPVDVAPGARARPRRGPSARRATRPGPTSSPASRSTRPKVTMCETTARRISSTGHGRRRRAPRASRREPTSRSSWYFSTEPSVACTFSTSSSCSPSAVSACAQSIVSATPGGFCRSSSRSSATNAAASAASRSGTPGTRSLTISISRSSDGWPIQWKRQRRLSASCSSRVRFEVRITHRALVRLDRPELGNGDLEVREHLEQERLELLVGAVDLVDQQHDRLVGLDRLEQRAPDQELGAEELGLVDRSLLRGADVQQLPRVVPLVDGVRDVEALVALEADQPRAERLRDRLRGLGLADPRLAFEQQRLLELQREEERRRQPAVVRYDAPRERRLELVDRGKLHPRSVACCPARV